ncbi:MAG: hypothetical protein V4507_12920, partial [Verrucomicrobiota bacterium]
MSAFLEFQGLGYIPTAVQTVSYRDRLRMRTRNHRPSARTHIPALILPMRFLLQKSVNIGLVAFRQTWKAALIVQTLIASLVICYFFVPQSHGIFQAISDLKKSGGLIASFLLMGGFVGLLSESISVLTTTRSWSRQNTENFAFNFIVFGLMGVLTDLFYLLQSHWIGSEASFKIIVLKMIIDQFVWTPLFASPYQVISGHWK